MMCSKLNYKNNVVVQCQRLSYVRALPSVVGHGQWPSSSRASAVLLRLRCARKSLHLYIVFLTLLSGDGNFIFGVVVPTVVVVLDMESDYAVSMKTSLI